MANKELKNYKTAVSDLTKFILYEQNNLRDPDVILQVGDAYFHRAHTKIVAGFINSNEDILSIIDDIEKSIKTYSLLNNPVANEKRKLVSQFLNEVKAELNK